MGGFISLSVSHPLACIPRSESGTGKWDWENQGVVPAPLNHGVVAPVREQKKPPDGSLLLTRTFYFFVNFEAILTALVGIFLKTLFN